MLIEKCLTLFTFCGQPCLGGDSKTLMFVNVSPDPVSVGESICSLRFAARVNSCEIGIARRQTSTRTLDSRLSCGWSYRFSMHDMRARFLTCLFICMLIAWINNFGEMFSNFCALMVLKVWNWDCCIFCLLTKVIYFYFQKKKVIYFLFLACFLQCVALYLDIDSCNCFIEKS